MDLRLPWYRLICALIFALTTAFTVGRRWEEHLIIALVDGQALFAQAADVGSGKGKEQTVWDSGGPRTTQRIRQTSSERSATYKFSNFNRDKVKLTHSIPESDFQHGNRSFGYKRTEIKKLRAKRDKKKRATFAEASAKGLSQKQFNALLAKLDRQYDDDVNNYLARQSFRIAKGGVISVNMPSMVRKNAGSLQPVAQQLAERARSKKYDSSEIVGAALSFVQTAMHYKQPAPVFKGKHTGGVLLPQTAFFVGWGDCDTKSGLMAAILTNWDKLRLVGVGVPGHYLLGSLKTPEKGDTFVQYGGLKYVLAEPAGPAWLPVGQVAEETSTLLANRDPGFRIEPFFTD